MVRTSWRLQQGRVDAIRQTLTNLEPLRQDSAAHGEGRRRSPSREGQHMANFPLCDDREFAQTLEMAYLNMWQKFLAGMEK